MGVLKSTWYISIVVAVAAAAVHYSFDHPLTGVFPLLVKKWEYRHHHVDDLSGKVFIVTGANTGLGLSTTKILAKNNGRVVMACRSMARCESAAEKVRSETPKAKLDLLHVDLSDLKSVQQFSDTVLSTYDRLDSLILNAGIMATPFKLTGDNLESQFAINVVAHTYMAKKLQGLLETTAEKFGPTSIVFLSSNAHEYTVSDGVGSTEEEINDPNRYAPWKTYGQSKLADILIAKEMAEFLTSRKVMVNSVHPGFVTTELGRYYTDMVKNALNNNVVSSKIADWGPIVEYTHNMLHKFAWDSDDAALTTVYVATSKEVLTRDVAGAYYVPIAHEVPSSSHSYNVTLQKQTWNLVNSILASRGFN